MRSKLITDEEIVSCGWIPTTVRIQKDWIDEVPVDAIEDDGDILISGWEITESDKLWYEMYRNSRRLTIVKKWYHNEVGQEWDTVLDCPITTPEELRNEMSYLGIKTDNI